MSSNIPGAGFEVAYHDGFLFTNSKTDDFMIHTTLPDQRFLLGTASNGPAVVIMTSNALAINKVTGPAYTLDVDGDINFTGTLYANNNRMTTSRWSSNDTFSNIYRTEGHITIGSNIFPERFNVYNGNAHFDSNVYVLSKLGVGTSTPALDTTMDVVGNAAISSNLKVDGNLEINKAFEMKGLYIKRAQNAVSATTAIGASVTNVNTQGSSMYLYIQGSTSNDGFHFVAGSNQNQIAYFRGDGNIGIGTSNPTYRLHVVGDIYATGNVAALSDSNYKTDLLPITDAIPKVLQLHGYTYTPHDPYMMEIDASPNHTRYAGLLAQDVEKVMPEVVMRTPDNRMSVAYGNMVALLVEAIKEQQKTIDALVLQQKEIVERIKRF